MATGQLITMRPAVRARMVGMGGRRPASEEEVVLAFLKGELESPRFGEATRRALEGQGGVSLVTTPDLDSNQENAARREALALTKGWGTNAGLFADFPPGVAWSYGVLDPGELQRTRYINYSYWIELSGGTRSPAGATVTLASGSLPQWIREMGTDWCAELAEAVRTRRALAPLILVGTPGLDSLVVLEGHARLTALFAGGLVEDVEVTAYVGMSPEITAWALF